MRTFLCSIDDTVWDAVEVGWTRPEVVKSTWDKAALAAANSNKKVLNAIFCGVSPDEFHKISYIIVAKEAWEILETTYEGTKKVKDTKLQMLTTKFEELKIGDDENSILRLTASREMMFGQNWIFPNSDRSYCGCIAIVTRLTATRESFYASEVSLTITSRLRRYCLTHEKRVFSISYSRCDSSSNT